MANASPTAPTPPPAPPPAAQKGTHAATAAKALAAFAKAAGLPEGSSPNALLKMFQACQAAVDATPSAAPADGSTPAQAALRALTPEQLEICKSTGVDPIVFAQAKAEGGAAWLVATGGAARGVRR